MVLISGLCLYGNGESASRRCLSKRASIRESFRSREQKVLTAVTVDSLSTDIFASARIAPESRNFRNGHADLKASHKTD